MNDHTNIIGVLSYRAPEKLRRALGSILQFTRGDFRLLVVHNPSDDPQDQAAREVIEDYFRIDSRVEPVWMETNVGYAGGVAELQRRLILGPGWGHLIYLENDAVVNTDGWNEKLCGYLDRYPEIGMAFPNGGMYPIRQEGYTEVMWGIGFCFALSRKAVTEAGLFDDKIGHQEEADYAMRIRMAGYTCACAPEVLVSHDATASNDPTAKERINLGIVQWVDKWNRYFNGKNFGYHSPQVTRWEDWPPNALYLERWFKLHCPGLNDNPEVVRIAGQEYDLIRVPRFKNFYRGRII